MYTGPVVKPDVIDPAEKKDEAGTAHPVQEASGVKLDIRFHIKFSSLHAPGSHRMVSTMIERAGHPRLGMHIAP